MVFGGATPQSYNYDVTWYRLPAGTETTTVHEVGCQGVCELSIAPAPTDHQLVLTGFLFETVDGTEHPVSVIAIEPDTSAQLIVAELNDGTDFTYNVTIQYAYVAESDVYGGDVYVETKTSKPAAVGHTARVFPPSIPPTGAAIMWQGFRAEYTDGVARPVSRFRLQSGGTAAAIRMADASNDDAFEATLYLVPGSF